MSRLDRYVIARDEQGFIKETVEEAQVLAGVGVGVGGSGCQWCWC